jgi:hypothetical protein
MHGSEAKYIHFFFGGGGEDCVKMDVELCTGLICDVQFRLDICN